MFFFLPLSFSVGFGFGDYYMYELQVRVPSLLGDTHSEATQVIRERTLRETSGSGSGGGGSQPDKPARSRAWRRTQLEERLKALRVPWDQGHINLTVDRKDFLTTVFIHVTT